MSQDARRIANEYEVRVGSVTGGCQHNKALEWTTTYLVRCGQSRLDMARDAALAWWHETDQSTGCTVSLAFDGGHDVFSCDVYLAIETIASVKGGIQMGQPS